MRKQIPLEQWRCPHCGGSGGKVISESKMRITFRCSNCKRSYKRKVKRRSAPPAVKLCQQCNTKPADPLTGYCEDCWHDMKDDQNYMEG
jgi:hypothetical protein